MILNLDFNLKNIDGTDAVENNSTINVAKLFSNLLYAAPADKDGLKLAEIAKKLYVDGKIEIDTTDLLKVEEFLNTPNKFTVAVYSAVKEAILRTQAEKLN